MKSLSAADNITKGCTECGQCIWDGL